MQGRQVAQAHHCKLVPPGSHLLATDAHCRKVQPLFSMYFLPNHHAPTTIPVPFGRHQGILSTSLWLIVSDFPTSSLFNVIWLPRCCLFFQKLKGSTESFRCGSNVGNKFTPGVHTRQLERQRPQQRATGLLGFVNRKWKQLGIDISTMISRKYRYTDLMWGRKFWAN